MRRILVTGQGGQLATGLDHVAFTWVHATRSKLLFFEHLHAFRFSI
jgi:hypothetical protein